MQDLTKGPVGKHIFQLASFIALSTLFQTLYFLADLFFVGKLGKEALAGVGLAGNLTFVVLALTQSLGVGATSLISQAVGRKDRPRAEIVFNQALVLSTLAGAFFGGSFFLLRAPYCRWLAADPETAHLALRYLNWFIPALFLQFLLVAMTAALRGIGDVKVPTAIQVATVLLNIVLNPILMFGWGTGWALGVAGTSLASFVSVGLGCVAFVLYFRKRDDLLRFRTAEWRPRLGLWGQMLGVGLPAGAEFGLLSVYLILVYDIMRPFGASSQAGFGVGLRLVQSLFLPTVAIAFATAPVAGQNYGAGQGDRVRQSFRTAASMSAALMALCTLLCQVASGPLIHVFSRDPAVVASGSEYLRIISWNFVASGIVFVSSSVFQGMGNTLPALASSSLRLVLFAIPAYAISFRSSFEPRQLWYLSVASVTVQVVVNVWLLYRQFAARLSNLRPVETAPAPSELEPGF
jgi:putative MATE family efflux protein